jgi:hypothetical protein
MQHSNARPKSETTALSIPIVFGKEGNEQGTSRKTGVWVTV